jgi:hypothetical protein
MMPSMDDEDESTYFEYLGRLVHTFSLAEAILFKFLIYYTGVSDKTARAIFSGVRVQEGISFIRRLMEIRRLGQTRKADIDNVLAQFAKINDLRNHLLHYQWSAEMRGNCSPPSRAERDNVCHAN